MRCQCSGAKQARISYNCPTPYAIKYQYPGEAVQQVKIDNPPATWSFERSDGVYCGERKPAQDLFRVDLSYQYLGGCARRGLEVYQQWFNSNVNFRTKGFPSVAVNEDDNPDFCAPGEYTGGRPAYWIVSANKVSEPNSSGLVKASHRADFYGLRNFDYEITPINFECSICTFKVIDADGKVVFRRDDYKCPRAWEGGCEFLPENEQVLYK